MEVVQFALLGLGLGAIYALTGQGIVAIYQGSGVLNFAQGALALLGAWFYARMAVDWGWPRYAAMALAVLAISVLGAAVYVLVMRPLRTAAPLVRLIATLGLLAIVQQAVILVFGSDLKLVPTFLPTGSFIVGDDIRFGYDRAMLIAIAIVSTMLLTLLYRRTKFGYATRAAAENRRAASALGLSPDRIGIVNWAIGGALAAGAGILTVPISGLNLEGIVLLVVPGLAAALVGGFRSFPLTLLGAVGIGVGQTVVSRYVTTPGVQEILPFVVIIVMLVVRGSAMPARDEETQQLPRTGRGPLRPVVLIVLEVALLWVVWNASTGMVSALVTTMVTAIVLISLVVLTGLAGQVSLGQFGLAGFGAFAAARATFSMNLPFPVAALFGVVAAVVVGLVFAVPALRTRGVTLAIATMGMALALERVVFNNATWIRGVGGTPVGSPSIFGWGIDPLFQPRRYATVAAVALLVVGVIAVHARSGSLGRRLLAVRSNERAATALGISVTRVKLFAFGLSAAIAAIGGILIGFRGATVRYEKFGVMESINALVYAIIGGIGFVHGAIVGALMAPNTVVNFLLQSVGDVEHYLVLGGGLLLIVMLIANPNGIGYADSMIGDAIRGRRHKASAPDQSESDDGIEAAFVRLEPRTLRAERITVQYGAVHAVEGVSLTLHPGRITGLIGANGAGKTSFIDAVSGFTRSGGVLMLDGTSIEGWSANRRAEAGIARTFQSLELFEDLSVRENLLVPTDSMAWWHWLRGLVHPSRDSLAPTTLALVARFGLESWLDHSPRDMPFGLRRLLSVARAAAGQPSILLVDEPAAGLNDHESIELGRALRWLADEWGMAILLVEHDVGLVLEVSDEIVAIDFGLPIFSGTPNETIADPRVRQAYLGEIDVPATEHVAGTAALDPERTSAR